MIDQHWTFLAQDSNIKCNKILFGNPVVPDNLQNLCSLIGYFGCSPRKKKSFISKAHIKYFNERRLESIFIVI